MLLWRISRHFDLHGKGGVYAPGRWHHRGAPIVYLAESPAGALIEACVHTSANDVPPSYTLLALQVEESISRETVDPKTLPEDWIDHVKFTRDIGSGWLESLRTALLRVPSALIPVTFNVLLNPLHADAAKIKVDAAYSYPFDPRIKR
ncbi:MAG TPA: RES domain-containing protein [Terriglobales bacterium]|nr:RES domain-containing protein [Terriglobales bacterium]